MAEAPRGETLTTLTFPSLIKVVERQVKLVKHHRLTREAVEKPNQQRHVVELLAAAVFWRIEVDLCKLAVEPIADRLPWAVERGVGHFHVDGAASERQRADIGVQQCGRE